MNLNQAILYAQLVNAAYAILPGNTTNTAGQTVTLGAVSYQVVTSIFANDLATDMNPGRGLSRVSIGLILQAATAGDVVIAIRGTEGIQEWIHDADFLLVTCPFLAGAGHTEDGFTAMYMSMTTSLDPSCPRVTPALASLTFPRPVTSVTICGHSLGGALATLLALDVAANTAFKTPTVRDAALRAPYLHNGSEPSLESLIEFYDGGGDNLQNLDPLLVPLGLSRQEKNALVAFIRALDSLNPEVSAVQPIPPAGLPK